MKLDDGRTGVAIALAVFAATVRGALDVPFRDEFTHGVVEVGIGSPSTTYTLQLDTGSANTFVGVGKSYVKTSTSKITAQRVAVSQGSASFSGTEYTDTLHLSGTTFTQSIGVASTSQGYEGVDGVLGLGPTDLTLDTLSPGTTTTIPTVADNLFSTGKVNGNIVTVDDGLVSFGAPLVMISDITYGPITTTSPASEYWGINAGFSYGPTTVEHTTAGIVDHGTTLLLLATDAFQRFLRATGAVVDSTTGLPVLASCTGLRPITLSFAGANIDIPVDQYRVPADQNSAVGGQAGKCYLAVNDLESNAGEGLDFIIGYNTLKHWTVVLDASNHRVGIAPLAIEV